MLSVILFAAFNFLSHGSAHQAPLTFQGVSTEAHAIELATFDLTEIRLVHVFGERDPRYMSEAEKLELHKIPLGFLDITEHPEFTKRAVLPSTFVPPRVSTLGNRNNEIVHSVEEDLEEVLENLAKGIATLSSFWTRSYKSPWGLASSDWIHDHVVELLSAHATPSQLYSVQKFSHKFFQNSIIARLQSATSKVPQEEREIIILSAHQDSLNYKYPFFRAPGADDDGSGSIVIVQVLRSLLEKDFVVPDGVAIEFHWYAAEEGGLLGSMDIATSYRENKKPVKAAFQIDSVAVTPEGYEPVIGLIDTFVNQNLSDFATTLIDKYNTISWVHTNCGKGCGSDHMSWNMTGFPSIYVAEGEFHSPPNPDTYHSSRDVIGQPGWNLTHATEFVKLGLAYITELAVSGY